MRSTSPSPESTVAAENVAVSFSAWTAPSVEFSASFRQRGSSESAAGLPASVCKSCSGTSVGVWGESKEREGSESAGSPIWKSVGGGKPGSTMVGASARVSASLAACRSLGGEAVTTSGGEESGIIRGTTGSRSPLRPSATVTGVSSAVAIVTLCVATASSKKLCVTVSEASLASSSLVVTSRPGEVLGGRVGG